MVRRFFCSIERLTAHKSCIIRFVKSIVGEGMNVYLNGIQIKDFQSICYMRIDIVT
jgi:hypothetical protein